MCLQLMIERAKENLSFGGINICVSGLEGLPALESGCSAHSTATAPCTYFSSILTEAARIHQLRYKYLCLFIWQIFSLFIHVLAAISGLLPGTTCEDNHDISRSKRQLCFLLKLVCKKDVTNDEDV